MRINRVGDVRCQVGEGPLWDAEEQALYFVDLVGRRLWMHRPDDGSFSSIEMPQDIAAVTRDNKGRLIVALADGFFTVEPAIGTVTPLVAIPLSEGTQINDGKVDPRGRFVVAGLDKAMKKPLAAIHSLQRDLSVVEIDRGFTIGNGPCWSPDGGTFYCADSIAKQIYTYDYDLETGCPSDRRLFADTAEIGGIPDGATVDERGFLWIAMCGAGKVARFSPEGELLETIAMPTLWVSSVMFGGKDLRSLYVTSIDPSAVGILGDEGCGYLYAVEGLDARGMPEPHARLDI